MGRQSVLGATIRSLTLFIALTAGAASCGNQGGAYDKSFAAWNRELRQHTPGREVAIIDLDALDHNIALVRARLGERFALRLVTKSLPSIELIRYLSKHSDTHRLMAFSESFVRELLRELGDTADILMGKPIPPEAARRLLLADTNARGVHWLVDTPERLFGYLELARGMDVRLNISFEIDVGMRRGGARDTTELLHLVEILAAHPDSLRFTGLMGYDGHVPYAPAFIGSKKDAVDEEFAAVHTIYSDLVEAVRNAHPELFTDPLTFNSGGSRTYFRYGDGFTDTPVNDIAMGSGFLATAGFDDLHAKGHRPAFYVASPVSKRITPGELPFIQGFQPWLAAWDPNMEVTFVMQGGGWPGDPVSPPGLRENSFLGSSAGGIRNLLPNQAILIGSEEIPLTAGDFIFFHPWESDALVFVDSVWLLRNGKIVGRWSTFRGGN